MHNSFGSYYIKNPNNSKTCSARKIPTKIVRSEHVIIIIISCIVQLTSGHGAIPQQLNIHRFVFWNNINFMLPQLASGGRHTHIGLGVWHSVSCWTIDHVDGLKGVDIPTVCTISSRSDVNLRILIWALYQNVRVNLIPQRSYWRHCQFEIGDCSNIHYQRYLFIGD